jgi:hypothetical protein
VRRRGREWEGGIERRRWRTIVRRQNNVERKIYQTVERGRDNRRDIARGIGKGDWGQRMVRMRGEVELREM